MENSNKDSIVPNPSVWLDGEPLEENAKYIHIKLKTLLKELGKG